MRQLYCVMIATALAASTMAAGGRTLQRQEHTATEAFLTLQGPYFGQTPPGAQPQIFMPGIVSTTDPDGCVAFLLEGRLSVFSSFTKGTWFSYEQDGRWTPPRPAPWQNEKGVTDFTAGPEGRRIYFQTSRPTSADDGKREVNSWVVEWTGEGWAEPRPLPSPPNSEEFSEGYPSLSGDGTLYFFSSWRNPARVGEIFRSVLSDGALGPAEPLADPINSIHQEVDPLIAPDGSYLLFGSGRPGGYTLLDLYVSFRQPDGSWTAPINGGQMFNSFGMPVRMNITPDGKYLFFLSTHPTDMPKGAPSSSQAARRWGDSDVYWVSTEFLRELKSQVVARQSAAEDFVLEYRERELQAALSKLEKLLDDPSNSHYLELSELLVLSAELVAEGKLEEADALCEALVESLQEELRIRQGYATACILNGQMDKGLQLLRSLWQKYPSAPSRSDAWLTMLSYQLGKRSEAHAELAVLRFITEEFPTSDGAWLDLARAYEGRGELERSREASTKALEINPDNADASELLERLEQIQEPG